MDDQKPVKKKKDFDQLPAVSPKRALTAVEFQGNAQTDPFSAP